MTTITFGPNNLPYTEIGELTRHYGVPAGIRFKVYWLDEVGDSVELIGPGYGEHPYGIGPIQLHKKTVQQFLQTCRV